MRVSRRTVLKWLAGGAAAVAGGALYGYAAARRLQVERATLELPRWDADGFRVALLADFHLTSDAALDRALEAASLAFAERPEAVLIAGDFVESSRAGSLARLQRLIDALGEARCPVLAVLGNHDYWAEQPKIVIERLREAKTLRLLRNEPVEVGPVKVGGLDDAIARRHRPAFLEGLGARNVIALFHEPDYVSALPPNVALHLAGHSHGGQVCLPGGKPLLLPKGARRYWGGFYPEAPVPLYVTRGVGTTGPDARAFCPPEVSILTLRRGG